MRFPKSPRHEKVVVAVNDFFINENIKRFPIDPFSIIQKNEWGLIKYSELAEIHDVSIKSVIKAYQSEDGYIICDNDNYTIAYNDTKASLGRIRFTLMHEIGHIYLNHLIDFKETILKRSELTKDKYAILEIEAHAFARNTLAPAIIIKELRKSKRNNKINIGDLMNWFNITHAAAKTRLDLLVRDTINSALYGLSSTTQFKIYLHEILYSKHCYRCKHSFVIPNSLFCPICSNKKLSKRKGSNIMIYSCYELNENGRAVICPRCENEQIIDDYCHVCGSYMLNKCTGFKDESENRYRGPWHIEFEYSCGTFLPGNARFCTNCGSTSSFYESGLLNNWTEAKKENEKKSSKYNELQIAASDDPFR